MVRQMNEDYKMGIKFLLMKCKEKGVNIRKVEWVPIFSRYLSEKYSCYKFWYNVYIQNRLDKIKLCTTVEDIAFKQDRVLFHWYKTPEGSRYWEKILFNKDELGDSSFLFNENETPLISFV